MVGMDGMKRIARTAARLGNALFGAARPGVASLGAARSGTTLPGAGFLGVAILAVALLGAPPSAAQDLVIDGCNILDPGEIGMRELIGDIDEIIPVHVHLSTNSIVNTIQFELEFPTSLLAFETVQPGELTGASWLFDGTDHGNRVRILGITDTEEDNIADGTEGTVATVRFRVLASGTGLFSLPADAFGGDLFTYAECDPANASPVESSPWGVIKSRYR